MYLWNTEYVGNDKDWLMHNSWEVFVVPMYLYRTSVIVVVEMLNNPLLKVFLSFSLFVDSLRSGYYHCFDPLGTFSVKKNGCGGFKEN